MVVPLSRSSLGIRGGGGDSGYYGQVPTIYGPEAASLLAPSRCGRNAHEGGPTNGPVSLCPRRWGSRDPPPLRVRLPPCAPLPTLRRLPRAPSPRRGPPRRGSCTAGGGYLGSRDDLRIGGPSSALSRR